MKPTLKFFLAAALTLCMVQAWAQVTAKQAEASYAADRKLCADETTSSIRMQCLRDAKAEYDKSMAAAKASTPKSTKDCPECGTVLDVNVEEKKGEGNALGMVAGGVAGAVLGHQVGAGRGKDLATVAGAAGGAYAGKKIQEKMTASKVWTVKVRFGNGEEKTFRFDKDPGYASGNRVKAEGGSIVRR